MKKQLFVFAMIAAPLLAMGQNYLFEITPTAGQFRVLITDDTRESYPRDITDFGLLDTAAFELMAYQRIENAKVREASLMAQSFHAQLNAEQTADAIDNYIALNYAAWVAARYATAYDGEYQYQVRGTAVNYPVVISGVELRRKSNNNLLATITPQTANWITVTAGANTIQLYQSGNFWVGRNANNQIVTLKKL